MSSETDIPGKYGKPLTYDPSFKGPIENRSCTDIICLLIFVIFVIGWVVLAGFAFAYGDPELLINPTDSQGNVCGKGKFVNEKFLFFFNILKCAKPNVIVTGCRTPQVCVKQCPEKTFSVWTGVGKSEEEIKNQLICKYDTDKSKKKLDDLIKDEDCAAFYIKSSSVVGRCIPDFKLAKNLVVDAENKSLQDENKNQITKDQLDKAFKNLARVTNAKDIGMKIFQDLKAVWKSILIALVISLVIAFIWILVMRWLAGVMMFFSIILVLGLLAFSSYYSYTRYKMLNDGPVESEGPGSTKTFKKNLDSYWNNKNTWLALLIISIIVLVILLLVLLFLRNRICIAIALIKEASRAVGCMMSTLLFPLLPYILHLIVFILWGVVALYLASTSKQSYVKSNAQNETIPCDENSGTFVLFIFTCGLSITDILGKEKCRFHSYVSRHIVYGQIYNLFGLLWASFFVMGFGQMSLAGAFASYYWAFNKPHDVPSFAVASSLCRTTRYHLGSIAFGSVLIAIVRFIRILLEYIDAKAKKYENVVSKIIICCCKCCFWCLEKFIKFINKNAYIMIAVYGKNFCTSAKDAFSLLMRNIVRVVVLDKVTDFLLLIGKLVVVGATAVTSFYFFTGKIRIFGYQPPELNYYIVPVSIITIGSYIISTAFFNVYSMGVDTLFLCFLEDCERNDGSADRPYYMSKKLMKILGKSNKMQDPDGD